MKLGRYNSATHSVDTYLVPTPTKSHVSFSHSIIHTDNYIIVFDCSVHFKPDALFMGGSFFKNNKDHNLKFGLIPKNASPKDASDVIWIDSGEVGTIVHPLHAWEEVVDDRTVIKLWTPFCKDLSLDFDKQNTFNMMEYAIDPSTKTVSVEVIDDTINSEFATMPPKASSDIGAETFDMSTLSIYDRYGYTAIFGDSGHITGYAKWDFVSRCLASTVYYDENEIGGEPVVVRAKKQAEDAADCMEEDIIYIGSYVYNEEEDQSYFILCEGETNQQVCRLKMPSRVPFGFHGQFISAEELEDHFLYHEAQDNGFKAQCPVKWIRFFIEDHILGQPFQP